MTQIGDDAVNGQGDSPVRDFILQQREFVESYAHSAQKTVILINGGATVALLAFIGSIWSAEVGFGITKPLAGAIACFALGVFFAACAAPAAYVSRLHELRERLTAEGNSDSGYFKTWSKRYNDAVFWLLVTSYGLLLAGIAIACIWFAGVFSD